MATSISRKSVGDDCRLAYDTGGKLRVLPNDWRAGARVLPDRRSCLYHIPVSAGVLLCTPQGPPPTVAVGSQPHAAVGRSHHAEESTYNRGGGAFEGYGTCVARLETTSKDALHLSSKQGPDFNDCTCKKASVRTDSLSSTALKVRITMRVSHVLARRFPC